MIREDYAKWLARARKHQLAGRPIEAMVCYRRALSSNSYAVQARYRLGEVLRDLGRPEEARAAWLAGLALSPGHLQLLLSLATTARQAGAHVEAVEAYERVLATNPQHAGARIGRALVRVAQGDEAAYAELFTLLGNGAPYRRWDDLTG